MVTMVRRTSSLVTSYRLLAVFGICAVVVAALLSCGSPPEGSLEAALAVYKQNNLEEAASQLEAIVEVEPTNADAFVWLAETYRRLNKKGDAIDAARRALELKPCDSFAHSVLADTYNPMYGDWDGASADSVWTQLQQAIECDPASPYPWLLTWGEAMHRGNVALVQRAARSMRESGFLTPAALEYGRWILRSLPQDAILITNGDMDTYPVAALQETEGLRTDVALVNRSLLNTDWYARYVRDELGVTLPVSDRELSSLRPTRDNEGNVVTTSTHLIRGWFRDTKAGRMQRPLAFTVTVSLRDIGVEENHLLYGGSYFLWHPMRVSERPDEEAINAGLRAINVSELSGPVASPKDWSPIRLLHSNEIVRNISEAGLRLAGFYIEDGQTKKAEEWLRWVEKLEDKTMLGPVSKDEIAGMRDRLY